MVKPSLITNVILWLEISRISMLKLSLV